MEGKGRWKEWRDNVDLPPYLHRLTMSGVASVDRVCGRKGGEAGREGGRDLGGTRKGLLDRLVGRRAAIAARARGWFEYGLRSRRKE